MRILTACLVGFLTAISPAQTPDDSKLALKARFEPASAPAGGSATLVVEVTVADGWHVYGANETQFGEPIALQLTEPGKLRAAGAAVVPAGDVHVDAGMTMHWLAGKFALRQRVTIPPSVPPGEQEVGATVSWTACDDSVCMPPQSQRVTAKLTVTAAAAAPPAPEQPAADPGKLSFDVQVEPATVAPGGTARVVVRTTVVPGWHVYGGNERELGEPIRLEVVDGAGLVPDGASKTPPGIQVTEHGITTWQLKHRFDLVQSLQVPAGAEPGTRTVKLRIHYTVCDESMCLPPDLAEMTATVVVAKDGGTAGPNPGNDSGIERAPESGKQPVSAKAADPAGADGGLAALLLAAVLAGLVTLLMPCTYPMIPITFSFFTKQADARGGRVLPLALTYGGGIVLIFVLIGVLFGGVIVPFAQHPVTNLAIGLLFFLFAFALFGLVNLEPPKFLLNLAGRASTRGGYGGVFLMGATLVVTSFTCTAPFVGSLLGVASTSLGHVIFGMAVFGLTMAVPFVWLALAPGWMKSMPRSGEWMHTIKVFLGFVELAAALKFFSNVDVALQWQALPRELFLVLWAAIFFVAGLYLLGTFRLKEETHAEIGPGRMVWALGTILFAFYCFYGALGYRLDDTIMQPIEPPYRAQLVGGLRSEPGERGAAHVPASKHEIIADDYAAARARAAATDRLLLVNFTGLT